MSKIVFIFKGKELATNLQEVHEKIKAFSRQLRAVYKTHDDLYKLEPYKARADRDKPQPKGKMDLVRQHLNRKRGRI